MDDTEETDNTAPIEDSIDTEFIIVSNIPKDFHAVDLRDFFSQFLESEYFCCFHFRRRPLNNFLQLYPTLKSNVTSGRKNAMGDILCCPVKVRNTEAQTQLTELCNGRPWLDRKGEELSTKCIIYNWKEAKEVGNNLNTTFCEFRPPSALPQGNVGTPTATFLTLIKQCRLPPRMIRRLGLQFLKSRHGRQYGTVSFDYGTGITIGGLNTKPPSTIVCGSIGMNFKPVRRLREENKEKKPEEETNQNSEDEEEWDRHTSLHGDAFTASREKERIYEKDEEVTWEKGGSGLVFHTDEAIWEEKRGDFDEKTADDWDVDMGVYETKDGGDKDARDFFQMNKEHQLRSGELPAIPQKRKQPNKRFQNKTQKPSSPQPTSSEIPLMDNYSNSGGNSSFAMRIMNEQGWKRGQGLGSENQGISEPLPNEGQFPWQREGFGYHGEKLERKPSKRKRRKPDDPTIEDDGNRVIIATIYDNKYNSDNNDSDNEPSTSSDRQQRTLYQKAFSQ